MTNKAILLDKTGVLWAYGFTRFTISDARYLLVVKVRGLPLYASTIQSEKDIHGPLSSSYQMADQWGRVCAMTGPMGYFGG